MMAFIFLVLVVISLSAGTRIVTVTVTTVILRGFHFLDKFLCRFRLLDQYSLGTNTNLLNLILIRTQFVVKSKKKKCAFRISRTFLKCRCRVTCA